jgi:CMD domain protein
VSATAQTTDVIDRILGIGEAGPVAEIRRQKPLLAEQLQAYYQSIFDPTAVSARALSVADRAVVAVRVASFTRSEAVAAWYAELAAENGVSAETIARARDIATPWTEDNALGAAIRHADLLTTRPSDSRQSDLQALKDAGLTPAGILSLSQTIAFVSYQLRLIAGLRAFGAQS